MKLLTPVLFVLLALSHNFVMAGDDVTIIDPYVRAVPPGQTVSAAFLQLENKSAETRYVVNATSPVSNVVELHSHVHENGMMKMRQIDSIEIPANGKAVLEPGGLHIMLIGLHDALKIDQKVSITLEFKNGTSQTIEAPVRKIMMKGMMKGKGAMMKDMKH
jgi:copper(I)-binding protein